MINDGATIHWDDRCIHVRAGTGTNVDRESGDVFRLTNPVQQTVARQFVPELLENPCGHLTLKKTGSDRVDGDVTRPKFHRKMTRQMMDRRFAGCISIGANSVYSRNMQTVHRPNINNPRGIRLARGFFE